MGVMLFVQVEIISSPLSSALGVPSCVTDDTYSFAQLFPPEFDLHGSTHELA